MRMIFLRLQICVLLICGIGFFFAQKAMAEADRAIQGSSKLPACEGRVDANAAGVVKQTIENGKFSINKNPFKYSKYYFDPETDFYYCKARYYSPALTSFISRDTYDLDNRYVYCSADPVMNTDPNGHMKVNVVTVDLLQLVSERGVRYVNRNCLRLISSPERVAEGMGNFVSYGTRITTKKNKTAVVTVTTAPIRIPTPPIEQKRSEEGFIAYQRRQLQHEGTLNKDPLLEETSHLGAPDPIEMQTQATPLIYERYWKRTIEDAQPATEVWADEGGDCYSKKRSFDESTICVLSPLTQSSAHATNAIAKDGS